MPKTVQKTLSFPLAGVARRRGYREQTRPYAAPWAVNVRGTGPLEHRERGGSRPGLTQVVANDYGSTITAIIPVTTVDGSGVRHQDLVVIADGIFSYLRGTTVTVTDMAFVTDTGVPIVTDAGDAIYFPDSVEAVNPIGDSNAFDAVERGGKLYLADSVLHVYDLLTGALDTVVATHGAVPTVCPLICLYQDRLILSGADHMWYACRQGDVTDWAFGSDMQDVGRAVAGQVDRAGKIGDVIQAMIPHNDSSLTFASRNGMWLLTGSLTTGTMTVMSTEIGVLSPTAWARSPDGTIAFLSNDGVYLMGGGTTYPTRWSAERVPDELRNVDPDANTITMAYDIRGRGFHLFITPVNGLGNHWWLDVENKALWPVVLQDGHQPIAVSRIQGTTGMSEVVLGCKDGYLRKFSDTATDDDGVAIESHVLLGPFRLTSDDMTDAVLTEIHGMMADNAGYVAWRVVMGNDAEVVSDTAVAGINAALASEEIKGVSASGVWIENRNKVERPRARGPWAIIWLSSAALWAYEAVAVKINQLGRLR